jgi:hypothetical protein
MQEDMHYYGTYAMARAAGLEVKDARIVAYAAQYVDDSTANDSEVHKDGGMFQTIATAHTSAEAIGNAAADHTEQRKVWVPFHFFPGNEGAKLSEKLACVKDSELAKEMVKNNIRHAVSEKCDYGLTLMGITAHVYADTFAHYGFSGVSSNRNRVDGTSFKLLVEDPKVKAYIMGKFSGFLSKYTPTFLIENYRKFVSNGASIATGALGHGAVGTYPDRPFLKWSFEYTDPERDSGFRENQETFLEACEKLHGAFNDYAKRAGKLSEPVEFSSIKERVAKIISVEGAKEKRTEAWVDAITKGDLLFKDEEAPYYSRHDWEQQKDNFERMKASNEMINTDVYKFHQAAIYHRDFTLKQLLPKHGIMVL